jgi:capsular exopolysaccharide synthesis family protein
VELRDYLRVIRARKWVIIQAVVIVTVAALVTSLLLPKTYQGEARVLISERDTGAALLGTVLPDLSSQPERALQTQVQLVELRSLAARTIRQLNLQESPDTLLNGVAVTAVGQTNIISIKATDRSPEHAAEIANSLAQAYVEWSKESKRASIKAAADEVQQRLDQSKTEILALGRKISDQGKSDELSAELQMATGAYTALASKLEELRVNEQLETGSGAVVDPAVVPTVAASPKPVRNSGLGLGVGLVFGVGMAFLYEYLDNTIKSDDEAERLYGVPVLGHIPFVKLEKGVEQHLAIVEKPGSPAAESFRVLRNSLDFINFEHNMKTLMVTSAAPGEGKSTVAANLAASLAQAGAKVAMVSCDFRRPTTEGFFSVPNVLGLSDVLLGRNSMKAALQRPGDEQLLVLTSGKMPPNPSELLGSAKMQELIESLEEWADWVIIDTPPLLAVSDGAAVARWADGVLLVSRGGVSTRESAQKGVEMLANVGANVIGVVISGSEEGSRDGGYYAGAGYYGEYYSYYSYAPRDHKRAKKSDSGARASVKVKIEPETDAVWIPPKSSGRVFAEAVGRVMAGVLSFVLVLVVAAALALVLDRYLGWGIMRVVLGLVGAR